MGTRAKVAALTTLVLALALGGVLVSALMSGDARAIGRTDPKRAANHRLPLRNFSETYTEGKVLGVTIGSTRADAINAANRAGLSVDASSWGDNRAGGADLYSRSGLLQTMSRQPYLNYYDRNDPRRGMTTQFDGDRVTSVSVYYINFEAL
jgi:hypothetical protein